MEFLKEGKLPTGMLDELDFVPGLVEDYAATDPSLEQVFLSFAREEEEARLLSHIPSEVVTKL